MNYSCCLLGGSINLNLQRNRSATQFWGKFSAFISKGEVLPWKCFPLKCAQPKANGNDFITLRIQVLFHPIQHSACVHFEKCHFRFLRNISTRQRKSYVSIGLTSHADIIHILYYSRNMSGTNRTMCAPDAMGASERMKCSQCNWNT